jgi:hypothetical protein
MTDQRHDSVAPPPPPAPVLPPPPVVSPFPATTLASPPGVPAFHPRGMLLAKAFVGPLKRATWIAGIGAVVIDLLLTTALGEGFSLLLAPVVAALGATAGVALAALTMPPGSRRAFESFAWLGGREMRRFEERTGTKVPTDPGAVERWLQDNPRSSATAWGRLELLAMLGRTDEAAAEQALIAPPTTDAEVVEQAIARQYTAFIATGTADESELDALQGRLPPETDLGLEILVARSIGEARNRLAHGRDGWRDPLLAVRSRLGWAATRTVVRDLWSKIAIAVFFISLAIGVVIATWPL